MRYKQSFFVEGRFFGETVFSVTHDPRFIATVPSSLLFFCYKCGEPYARCPVEPLDSFRGVNSYDSAREGGTTQWVPIYGVCKNCPSDFHLSVPGSLFYSYGLVERMPLELLKREFALQSEYFKKLEQEEGE